MDISIRRNSPSSIQYIIFQNSDEKPKSFTDYILNPTNKIFFQLIKYPRDFAQFVDQELYVSISLTSEFNPAFNCLILNGTDINKDALSKYCELLELRLRPCVYFIDSNCFNLDDIINYISNIGHSIWFFNLYDNQNHLEYLKRENYFENNEDLIKLLYKNFDEIKKNLIKIDESFTQLEFVKDNEQVSNEYNFNLLENNYRVIRELKYKVWKNIDFNLKFELDFEKRPNEILNSLKEVDEIHYKLNSKLQIKKTNNSLPILIAVFPFNNPNFKKIVVTGKFKNKTLSKAFLIEQNVNNYTFEFESFPSNRSAITAFLKYFLAPRFAILDGLSFLHSTFTFSPTIRFPLIGNSINKELSYFNPEFDFFNSPQALKNKLKAIKKFGNGLKNKLFQSDIGRYIENRNGQILAISDLPIEWLCIDNVPLILTHDVCRIQESNYQGIVNNYSANNRLEIKIPGNILEKTLIILSGDGNENSEIEFKVTYKLIEKESETLNYNYRYCNNIGQVSKAIQEVEPFFLIFDCHGDVNSELNTSFLCIGEDEMYAEHIITNNISAPIVFLSCCNTNPNFGYLRKLHDAFFQAGAMSVTGTFQPITIKRGTLYYIRLLRLLALSDNKSFYDNWLSFICHVIRSSIIHDFMNKSFLLLGRELTDEESMKLSSILNAIMIFSSRRKVFEELISKGLRISEDINIRIEDTDCEILMYTHYGRPDLILFS